MKKIVIIGASNFQNPLILKAKEVGYETHVFAWKCNDIGERTADYFYPISIVEKEKILELCKKIKPDCVASVASDIAVLTVNYLSRHLGLNCNCEDSDLITTNKYLMRQQLRKENIWTPNFLMVGEKYQLDNIKKLRLPLIVKPTDRSGSRGVYKIEQLCDLEEAIDNAIKESFEKKVIIEEYIDGEEYSCECISFHSNHYFLTITQKFTTGAPHYIETGHMEPSDLSEEMVQLVKSQVFATLTALKISDSASHCEFKIDGGQVKIIEVGARMGGDCIGSHLVYYSTGYDFLKMVIDVAEGKKPQLERKEDGFPIMIRFVFNDKDRKVIAEIQNDNNIEVIESISENKDEQNVTDSSNRKGYFILKAKTKDALRRYYPEIIS